MNESEEVPLILWEVKRMLEKRKGDASQWDKADQRRVYEHADKFNRLEIDDALELLDKLINENNIPRVIAAQITDTLPVTIDELDAIFKAIEEIAHQAKLQSESELPSYVRDIIHFYEKLEAMSKDEREAFQKKLLELLRDFWKKSRRLTEKAMKESKE